MRPCTVCTHAEARQIALDLLNHVSFRTLEKHYGVSNGALSRHLNRCLPAAVQTALYTTPPEPALTGLRKLHQRTLHILTDAEDAQDPMTAVAAIREARRNLELIAKLTGELDPRASETGGLQVQITYVSSEPPPAVPSQVIDALPASE